MKKIYSIIIVSTLILIGILAYQRFAGLNIIVKFDDLEPFEKQIPVYYKGFKTGKSVKIYPDKDYIYSYVKIKITPHDVRIPSNIEAKLQKGPGGDYITIIAPKLGTVKKLKDGDIIKGSVDPDLKTILAETVENGNIGSIMESASNVMISADKTMQELTALFSSVNSVIDDIRGDLKKASENLANTTKNISLLSSNINGALDKETINYSVENIKETTAEIKEISKNLEKTSEQINKITVPRVNNVLCQTERTMYNTAELTEDIQHSVKERKGITRLLFGSRNN